MRWLLIAWLLVGASACGSDKENACVQGETQPCLCIGGGAGVQTCQTGGNSWGECLGCKALSDSEAPSDLPAGSEVSELSASEAPSDLPAGSEVSELSASSDSSAPSDLSDPSDSSAPSDLPDCPFASCAGICCAQGQSCFEEKCCQPQCSDEIECGDDGCGGLCGGCLDIAYDDGDTDTAYGYSSQPEHEPTRIACAVRFELPQKNMRLLRFAAGWMYGLYALQVPFELGYVVGEDMACEEGSEAAWYNEWCAFTPDEFVPIGDFLPLEPYKPMEADLLGEVILPAKTIYMVTMFTIDEYPIFVCPIDTSGDGSLAFMMSEHKTGQVIVIDGSSFDQKGGNEGVIPFRIRVQPTIQ
jgi:hypothetical protein